MLRKCLVLHELKKLSVLIEQIGFVDLSQNEEKMKKFL